MVLLCNNRKGIHRYTSDSVLYNRQHPYVTIHNAYNIHHDESFHYSKMYIPKFPFEHTACSHLFERIPRNVHVQYSTVIEVNLYGFKVDVENGK